MNRPESLKYEKVAQEAWRDLGSCLESCVKAAIGCPQAPVHTEVFRMGPWGGTVKLLAREGMGVKNASRGMM